MNKYLIMALISLGLTSCGAKDEQYYRTHREILQQAIKNCPSKQPEGMSCEAIVALGSRLNGLAYLLQLNPQAFGNKILETQQTIAKQKIELNTKGSNEELKLSLEQNEHALVEYLTVVKWLESPEG